MRCVETRRRRAKNFRLPVLTSRDRDQQASDFFRTVPRLNSVMQRPASMGEPNMTEPVVLCAIDSRGVATLTLNRPAVNNAYNAHLLEALTTLCGKLAGDAQVRVVVIRGNGAHFQAGADLTWLQQVAALDEAANLAASVATAEATLLPMRPAAQIASGVITDMTRTHKRERTPTKILKCQNIFDNKWGK